MRPLRIGIVTTCMDERVARGTALVARRFVERLPVSSAEFSFTLIHARRVADPLYQRFSERVYPQFRFPVGSAMCNEALFWLRHWIREDRFDIVHYLQPRVWPTYLLTHSTAVAVTPHDAGIMLDLHPMGRGERLFRFTNRHLHQRMRVLFAVSAWSAQEIRRTYHVAAERVIALRNGVDDLFHPNSDLEQAHKRLKERYGFPDRYILSVGRFDPHKNILRVLEAYEQYRVRVGGAVGCVLVGGPHDPATTVAVQERISRSSFRDDIVVAPYIAEEDMPLAYRAAEMLVYPSLHEGCGLPIIEAMRCATPVITSNTTALPETAGGAAFLVSPTDVHDITQMMVHVSQDDVARAEMVQRGLQHATKYTWDALVQTILQTYRTLGRG